MTSKMPDYFAYLLRIWRVDDDTAPVWRASLQRPGEVDRHGFASLNELFDFLRHECVPDPKTASPGIATTYAVPDADLPECPDPSTGPEDECCSS